MFPANNNAASSANLQLPTMNSDTPPDWFLPQSSMNNPTNGASMNAFGAGLNMVQQAPNSRPHNSQSLMFPSTSFMPEMGGNLFDLNGNPDGGVADPSEQSGSLVAMNETASGQANNDITMMEDGMVEGDMDDVEGEGDETIKDSANEKENVGHESDDATVTEGEMGN